MDRPTRILICILTTQERSGWPCPHLLEWAVNTRANQEYQVNFWYAHNIKPAAGARNSICRVVKDILPENKPDWLLMIDNDMLPPANLLDAIKNAPADAGVLVPRFYMWDEKSEALVVCWGMNQHDVEANPDQETYKIIPGKHYPLTKAGTGAIFIRPELIEELEPPLFWYTFTDDGAVNGTEDINFCRKVLATKWKMYGVSDVEVGHYHNVNLAQLARQLYVHAEKIGMDMKEFPEPCSV